MPLMMPPVMKVFALVVADTYNQTVRELLAPFSVGVAPNGEARTISWESVIGRSYQVQFKNSVASSPWLNLGGPHTASALTTVILGPTTTATEPQYYRVLRLD